MFAEMNKSLKELVDILKDLRKRMGNANFEDIWFEYHEEFKPLIKGIKEELEKLNDNLEELIKILKKRCEP